MHTHRAFTLIELLVVVTIIVLLTAMLVPALEEAVQQAKMAKCSSNLKGIGNGVLTYTSQNQALYPHRPSQGPDATWGRPNNITANSRDDRPIMRDYVPMALLVDPLSGQVDFSLAADNPPNTHLFANYALWYGIEYPGESGMFRLTERMEFDGQQFRVLASDDDTILAIAKQTHVSHPDRGGLQQFQHRQEKEDEGYPGVFYTYSRWNGQSRGPIDSNYAFTDGSVHRYNGVRFDEWRHDDATMTNVPTATVQREVALYPAGFWTNLPR